MPHSNDWELFYKDPVCESEDRVQRALKAVISSKMVSVGDIEDGRKSRESHVEMFLDDVEEARDELNKILEKDKEKIKLRKDFEMDEPTHWDMDKFEDKEGS